MSSISSADFQTRFKRLEEIGKGGFGTVYKLIDRVTNKIYALKNIPCPSLDHVSISMQEIILPFKVKSQFIITINFYFIEKKKLEYEPGRFKEEYSLGIIMEYASYSLYDELSDKKKRGGNFSKVEIYEFMRNFISVLAEMQENKIVHRDIKPENILKTEQGYKLTDFGLARYSELSKSHHYAGSPLYASPLLKEFNDNNNIINFEHNLYKSDVFSLGLILLECCCIIDIKNLNNRKSAERMNFLLRKIYQNGYDKWFVDILSSMLEYNEYNRPDFIFLNKIIHQISVKNEPSQKNPFLNPPTGIVKENLNSLILKNSIKTENLFKNNEIKSMEKIKNLSKKVFNNKINETILLKSNKQRGFMNLSDFDSTTCSTLNFSSSNNKNIQEITTIQKNHNQVLSFHQFSNNFSNYLITCGENFIELFFLSHLSTNFINKFSVLKYEQTRFNDIISIKLPFHDQIFIVAGTSQKSLCFFEFGTRNDLIKLNEITNIHNKAISCLAYNPNENTIISGSSDLTIRVGVLSFAMRKMKYQLIQILLGHADYISCIQYNLENNCIVSGDNNGIIIVWNGKTGFKEDTYKAHAGWITSLKIIKEKSDFKIMSSGEDNKICLKGLKNGIIDDFDFNEDIDNDWISSINWFDDIKKGVICKGKGGIILFGFENRFCIEDLCYESKGVIGASILKNNNKYHDLVVVNLDRDIHSYFIGL